MKLVSRQFVYSLLPFLLLLANGCEKKKPKLPPQGQAPTVAVVLPDELPLTKQSDNPTPQPPESSPATTQAKVKPKKQPKNSPAKAKKSAPVALSQPQQSASENQTVATLRPHATTPEAVPETTLGAAVSSSKLQQQREETTRMVDSTENALKGINRSLSDDEKSVKSQIESFLQQSRKATTDGDYERAFNLAKKAQLLAEALIKK